MNVRLIPFGLPADAPALVDFLTGNNFPFHAGQTPTREQAEQRIASGTFRDDEHDSFWLVDDELGRVGYIRLEDLQDPSPMLDLRLADEHRGKGLGAAALRAAADHVFTTLSVERFEGCTREDNIAMRRTFEKAGWVQEAHFRRAWPVTGAEPKDAVNYSILRQDWESVQTTPVMGLGEGTNPVHHIELWTHDLADAEPSFDWLMTELGWPLEAQDWPAGRSWLHPSGAYLTLEQSPAVTAESHDRMRPGLNHLALTVPNRATLDRLRTEAPRHGWSELFAENYPHAGGPQHTALFLENNQGFEFELVAVP